MPVRSWWYPGVAEVVVCALPCSEHLSQGSSALVDVLLAVLVRGFALQDVAVGWGLLSHQLAPVLSTVLGRCVFLLMGV